MKKKLIAVFAAVILIAMSATGTIAFLKDSTAEVENTFTVGNITIALTETAETYTMVPGADIHKDPVITVSSGSEACWLFVKAEKSADFDNYMSYTMNSSWTAQGSSYPGVFYYNGTALDESLSANKQFPVIKDNKVSVVDTVTEAQLAALTGTARPTLTFTAYAVQKFGFSTPTAAWLEAQK